VYECKLSKSSYIGLKMDKGEDASASQISPMNFPSQPAGQWPAANLAIGLLVATATSVPPLGSWRDLLCTVVAAPSNLPAFPERSYSEYHKLISHCL